MTFSHLPISFQPAGICISPMSGKLNKVVMFMRLCILLLLFRPFGYPEMFLIRIGERFQTAWNFYVEKYIPQVTLMTCLAMFGSLDGGSVSAMFSSACSLSLWLFSSNSTLRNPTQYKIIPNAETALAKEGKLCFWAVISMRVWVMGGFDTWGRYLILQVW